MNRIYVKGNYLIMSFADGQVISQPRKNISFTRVSNTDYFEYVSIDKANSDFNNVYAWQNLAKEDGSPFISADEFETFILNNTGNFNSGSSGGGIDPQNYDLADFKNQSSDPFTQESDLINKADLVDGKVPASQLPSYVDDVLEFANLASFPSPGEAGKLYVALDSNKIYRWTGSAYIEVSSSSASTPSLYPKVDIIDFIKDSTNYIVRVNVSNLTTFGFAGPPYFEIGLLGSNPVYATGMSTNYDSLLGFSSTPNPFQVGGFASFIITFPIASNTSPLWSNENVAMTVTWKGTDNLDSQSGPSPYNPRRISSDTKLIKDLKPALKDDFSKYTEIRDFTYTQDATNYYANGKLCIGARNDLANNNAISGGVRLYFNGNLQTGSNATVANTETGWFVTIQNITDHSGGLVNMGYTVIPFRVTIPKATHTNPGYSNGSVYLTIVLNYTSFSSGHPSVWVPFSFKTVFDTVKQDLLVSGTNIKTFNGTSLLGAGNIAYKNEAGQVKINYTGLTLSGFTAGNYQQFNISGATPTIVSSPTTKYPNSTPNNYNGVFDATRNGGSTSFAGRLIENPINGQVHKWRIQGNYSGKSVVLANTQMLYIRLRNPVSGFEVIWDTAIPPNQNSGNFTLDFMTISDGASIPSPNGYIIDSMYTATDAGLNVNFSSITRVSEAIEP